MLQNVQDMVHEADNGRVFSVTFIKRTDGSLRTMNCRRGVRKGLTGVGQSYKPADYNLLTVWDMQKSAYRNINLETIVEIKMGGKVYRTVPAIRLVVDMYVRF